MYPSKPHNLLFKRCIQFAWVLWASCVPAMYAYGASESFSYNDGLLEGAGPVGVWDGPWAPGSESAPPLGTSPFTVESGQMRLDLTDTAKWEFNESDVRRTLSSPVSSPSVYMSFEVTPGEMGNVFSNSHDDGYAGLVVGFADNATNIGTNGPMITMFEYFEDFGSVTSLRFATSLGGVFGQSNITITDWTPGTTYTLVGRLDFDASGLDEAWSVWLDPVDESSTPQAIATADLGYSEIGMTQMFHYIYNFENTEDSFVDNLLIGSTWDSVVPLAGDLDLNAHVGATDLDILLANWGETVIPGDFSRGDATGDGVVGQADLDQVLNHWGDGTPPGGVVPEPGAALTYCGLILLFSRRVR